MLLTIQKIIPFYILSFFSIFVNKFLFYIIILICSIIPLFNIINLIRFKILLTYSSINQSSWLIILIYFKNFFWLIYLITYSLILFSILLILNFYHLIFNNINLNFLKLNINLLILFIFINIARLPPFTFFILKWYNIFLIIINSNLYILLLIIIIRSFIILYIYINISSHIIFFWLTKIKLFYLNKFLKFNFFYLFFFFNLISRIIILLI